MTPTASITTFTVSPAIIDRGERATLFYEFANGTGHIDQGIGAVSPGGTTVISPTSTKSYTLTVQDSAGSVISRTVSVTVRAGAAPSITSFRASPVVVTRGGRVALHFEFENGSGTIDHGIGAVTSGGTKVVTPSTTTTYTLTVVGTSGARVSQAVAVTVVPEPRITSFTANPPTLAPGGNLLTAVFDGGAGSINQGVGAVVSGTPVRVTPATSTSYVLTVTNAAGRSIDSLVEIVDAPTITVGCPTILPGGSTSMRFAFGSGTGVLSGNGTLIGVGPLPQPVSNGQQVTVSPNGQAPGDTTTFTLTVTLVSGLPISQTATVTNLRFSSPESSSQPWFDVNQGTYLTATFGSGGTAVVMPGNITLQNGVAQFVRPAMPTRYSITVTHATPSTSCAVVASHFVYPKTYLSGGTGHTVALKSNGTVWTWGWNAYGQLGNGTTADSPVPVQVLRTGGSALTGIVAISAGNEHNLAVDSVGNLWAWGDNDAGQLGNGTTTDSTVARLVLGLPSPPKSVVAGDDFSRALLMDGTVWAWGLNDRGQIGDGSTINSSAPRPVSNLSGVGILGGGEAHSVVLMADGRVRAWGWNVVGQLGDGSTTDRTRPVAVAGLTDAVALATGGEAHSLALTSNGGVMAWGLNSQGQLGDGTTANRHTPINVFVLPSDVTCISAGQAHSLAIRSGGSGITSWAWGRNHRGQLGTGGTSTGPTTQPTPINTTVSFVAIAGGWYHSLAVRASYFPSGGTVWAWGYNSFGQVANGAASIQPSPYQVPSFTLW